MGKHLLTWLSISVVALVGTAINAGAETFGVAGDSVTKVGSLYDWTFTLTDTGGTFALGDTVGIIVPGSIAGAPGPSGWLNVGGAPIWTDLGAGGTSATFTVESSASSGTATIAIADIDLSGGGVTLTVDPSVKTGMPETGFSFYLTLGFGILALVVMRNRYRNGSRFQARSTP